MKETKWGMHSLVTSGIFLILVSLTSCQKTEYDLLDPETAGVWTQYTSEKDGLPGNEINDIELDSLGRLWVAFAQHGVGVYSDGSWTYFNTSNSPLLNNSVTTLEPLPDGGMLIGTYNGLSILWSNGTWSSYIDPEGTQMDINALKVESDGTIWIGTNGQGYYAGDGSFFYQYLYTGYENINAFEEDTRGNFWMGTDNGLVVFLDAGYAVFTTADGLPDNTVTSLFVDSHNRVWIGTENGFSVGCFDYDYGLAQLSLMNGLVIDNVNDIYEDKKGDMWFALWDCGLVKYDFVIGYSYKVYNGFYENDVKAIGADKDGNLWIGLYRKGLVRYTLPIQ